MGDVTVRLAGRLEVLGGEDRSAGGPGGPVPRRLLALLAVHRGRTVPTPEIVDVLWATEPPKRPERAVATLVSRLRARYGSHLVTGGPPGYRLGAEVRVDLDQAAALVAVCERDLDPGPGRAALDLLAEEELLIGEPDAEWTRPARTTFDGLRRRARLALAAAALAAGDVGEARRTAAEAAAADPLDEPAHLLLMRASDRADALRAYERLRSALRAELGVGPSVEVRAAHAALLGGPAPEPAGARPALGSALVGRGPELARIAAAWSAARGGPARLVLVAGEGGMGKTRLVGVAAAATGRALEARCYAGERSLFLQPLADALAALPPERVREWAGPLADALGGVFPALAEGSAPPPLRRIFDALVAVLRGLTARHPAVLVLDDLHNASPSTVEFLHYLARRGADVRLLVLVTVRAHEGRTVLDTLAEVGERLDLGPLDEHAVARLAAAAGRPDLAAVLTARTRGHTLFVVESLRGLAAGEDGVPETLQAVVLARLRRVGRAVEDVLRAGAVLGPALDPAVVAGMLGRSPLAVAQACADAEAEGLLVPAERTYEFANDLVQEAIYRSTAPPLRITHHRRAADLLAGVGGDGLEALATHALAAGDHARAARALLAAAGRAAPTDAEALLTGALATAAGDDDLRARVLLARGRCREVLGAWSAGLADLRVARAAGERAGDRRTVMLADRELGGHSAYALGEPLDTGAAHLAAALRAAGELGDRAAAADTLGWSAVVATNRLRFAEAVALGGRAVREARSAGTERALVAALDGLKTGYA